MDGKIVEKGLPVQYPLEQAEAEAQEPEGASAVAVNEALLPALGNLEAAHGAPAAPPPTPLLRGLRALDVFENVEAGQIEAEHLNFPVPDALLVELGDGFVQGVPAAAAAGGAGGGGGGGGGPPPRPAAPQVVVSSKKHGWSTVGCEQGSDADTLRTHLAGHISHFTWSSYAAAAAITKAEGFGLTFFKNGRKRFEHYDRGAAAMEPFLDLFGPSFEGSKGALVAGSVHAAYFGASGTNTLVQRLLAETRALEDAEESKAPKMEVLVDLAEKYAEVPAEGMLINFHRDMADKDGNDVHKLLVSLSSDVRLRVAHPPDFFPSRA
jgi:hypothetical protein